MAKKKGASAGAAVTASQALASDNPLAKAAEQVKKQFKGLSGLTKLGLGTWLLYWVFSNAEGRALIQRVFALASVSGKRFKLEADLVANDVRNFTEEQAHRLQTSVVTTILLIVMSGLVAIFWAASIHNGGYRALAIDAIVLFVFFLLLQFWAQWIPGLIGVAIAFNYLSKEAGDKLKVSLSSFWSFLTSGPRTGLPEGLRWVGKLWQFCMMTAFWYIVGSQVLSWVPYYRTPDMLPKLFTVPFLFMLGPLVWGPTTRGREVSWVLWAQLFLLIDSIYCAVMPAVFYWPIMHQEVRATAGMLIAVTAEGIACYFIVQRSRRPAAPVAPAGGHMFRSQQITVQSGLHPVLTLALVVVGLFVGLYIIDPSHQFMAPYHWILGK